MVDFDPLAPEFQADPYPVYDRLRASTPLYYWEAGNIWFVTNYEACVALLKHGNLGHEVQRDTANEEPGRKEPPARHAPLFEMHRHWMLLRDPPAHTRLRALVHEAFTPRMIDRLQSRIQTATEQLIDAAQDKGEMDVIEDFAAPLPVMVIADMVGIPECDRGSLRRWSRDLADTVELTDAPEVYDRGAAATVEFSAYLRDLARERRRQPRQDLMTALVQAEDHGDTLTEQELISTCILLLVAGHETSTNFIGNGVLALLRHPEQVESLKARPELGRSAIEELLRYDSPVQATFRTVLHELEFDGRRLPAGASVAFMLGSANRDPAVFNDPQRLDISRDPNPHLSFSYGIHYCLGAPLARLEGQIAIQTLLRRAPGITLVDDSPAYRRTWAARGLEALRVRLG